MSNFRKVQEFHDAFKVEPMTKIKFMSWELDSFLRRRLELLKEEYEETRKAYIADTPEEAIRGTIDGLIDVIYIAYGTLDLLGVDADKAFAEVHRSNMSKLGEDGEPIVDPETRKVKKGPNYSPPNLSEFVDNIMLDYME